MIKTLFLTGARVSEFVHIRVEDLHLDDDPPRIHLTHAKGQANRHVPILPALAQELRTHLQGRLQGYLFESNRHTRYAVRTVQTLVQQCARAAGLTRRVHPHLLRHSIATILLDSGLCRSTRCGSSSAICTCPPPRSTRRPACGRSASTTCVPWAARADAGRVLRFPPPPLISRRISPEAAVDLAAIEAIEREPRAQELNRVQLVPDSVEVAGIDALDDPLQVLADVPRDRIAAFQERPGTAAILRRRRPPPADADRIRPPRFRSEPAFDPDLMLPRVAEVVLVSDFTDKGLNEVGCRGSSFDGFQYKGRAQEMNVI